MIFFKAFLVGGLICALVQIIIDKTNLTPARIMVGTVCLGVILSAIGIYQPFAEFAEAGATVPLLGFGHNLWKGIREAIDSNGILGLFLGGFKASAVGISAALVFSFVISHVFKSKMP
ncbi:MAG: stage V sporulation protein AE [Eubacterium sp.]|nr:stage V sporulation protein AE [Eubacterium sp.]